MARAVVLLLFFLPVEILAADVGRPVIGPTIGRFQLLNLHVTSTVKGVSSDRLNTMKIDTATGDTWILVEATSEKGAPQIFWIPVEEADIRQTR